MSREDIIIGKKVYYHPILGGKVKKEVTIVSEVFEICGINCCMVDKVTGCVDIESLTEYYD